MVSYFPVPSANPKDIANRQNHIISFFFFLPVFTVKKNQTAQNVSV